MPEKAHALQNRSDKAGTALMRRFHAFKIKFSRSLAPGAEAAR